MHFIELNVVGGASICLPIGSFIFSVGNEGGTIVRMVNDTNWPILVDESYEYIMDVLTTCACDGVYVHRAPEED